MKGIGKAILAVCFVTFGCLAVRAQTNTGYGTGALAHNTSGVYNSAFGYNALYANTSGGYNTAAGAGALYSNTTASYNTATGFDALLNNTGSGNTAAGAKALESNTTGGNNTATGEGALYSNTSGGYNTAAGAGTLYSNTTASYNTAAGFDALLHSSGSGNTAAGEYALNSNTTGGYNTAEGTQSLYANTSGSYNIGIGYQAGYNNTTGSNNIDIGSEGASSDDGVIRIGGSPGSQSAFFAAGIYGVNISGVQVYITSSGQLGIVNSSIRFKKDVQNMGDASSAIYRLRPVTYRYKKPFADGSDPVEYGLIAEEVARVYPDLVARNADGTIQTVEYQKLTPMMLNELQKQDPILQQMEKTIEQQQQTIQLLKSQRTETIRLLERRLATLEAASSSTVSLEARLDTK